MSRSNIFIGCGGTGFEVLMQLKRFIHESSFFSNLSDNPDFKKLNHFLFLDTVGLDRQENELKNLIKANEYINLVQGGVYAHAIINNKNSNTDKWWYNDWPNPPPINEGARQVTALGRLAFYYRYTDIKNQLENIIEDICLYKDSLNNPLNGSNTSNFGINTFIIGSIAGGTGAGIFLDTAVMVKDLLEGPFEASSLSSDCFLLLLSGSLYVKKVTGHLKDRVKMNSFKSLYEISRFLGVAPNTINQKLELDYPNDKKIVLNDTIQKKWYQ